MFQERITFTLEALTPIFLSGADQAKAELRSPSLRGVMRYWFRAMMGRVLGGDYQKLKGLESQVWGSTQRAGNIILRLKDSQVGHGKTQQLDEAIPGGSQQAIIGRRYLLYSVLLRQQQQYQRPEYVEQGGSFTFEMHVPKKFKDLALGTLWLVGQFGALGTRSRRGLGALRLASCDPGLWAGLDMTELSASPQDYASKLKTGLLDVRQVFARFAQDPSPTIDRLPLFPCLVPKFCTIGVLNIRFSSWCEALDHIGRCYAKFRQSKSVKNRAAFGLPIIGPRGPVYFKERRASPLFIRLFVMEGTEPEHRRSYGLVLLCLKSRFLSPTNSRSAMEKPEGGYRIIDEFLNGLPIHWVNTT